MEKIVMLVVMMAVVTFAQDMQMSGHVRGDVDTYQEIVDTEFWFSTNPEQTRIEYSVIFPYVPGKNVIVAAFNEMYKGKLSTMDCPSAHQSSSDHMELHEGHMACRIETGHVHCNGIMPITQSYETQFIALISCGQPGLMGTTYEFRQDSWPMAATATALTALSALCLSVFSVLVSLF